MCRYVGNECVWEMSLAIWKVRDEMGWKDKIPDMNDQMHAPLMVVVKI